MNFCAYCLMAFIVLDVSSREPAQASLEGDWVGVSLETNIGLLINKLFEDRAITIKDSVMTVKGEKDLVFKLKLDSTKEPKHIDLVDEKGRINKGIYLLEDTVLKIALAYYPDKERPASFKRKPDSKDFSVLTIKRKAK